MRLKKILSVFLLAVFCLSGAATGVQAAELFKLPTAWIDRHETFLIWYAKERGWDREEGLDIDIQYFASGKDIVDALPSKAWVFAGMGDVSAMNASVHYGTSIIAVANDEGMTSAVLVRKDSPILKVKGWNKDYPDIYGSPELIRGKTFLSTSLTSSNYALSSWLHVFGLKRSDVIINNMDQTQALVSFDNNIGDGVALWSPYVFTGMEKGWKVAGDLHKCKLINPIMIVADSEFAEAHPDITAKFLKVYLKTVDLLQKEPLDRLVPEYQRFFLEWAGKNYDAKLCLNDLVAHPVFNIHQQLDLFDESKGESKIQTWHKDIINYLNRSGAAEQEAAKAAGKANATDKYLRLLLDSNK